MKKIVALVLCLVLALSLCTVAMAEKVEYKLYDVNDTTTVVTDYNGVTIVKKAAAAPVVRADKTGFLSDGNVEYYLITKEDGNPAIAVEGTQETAAYYLIDKNENKIWLKSLAGDYAGVTYQFNASAVAQGTGCDKLTTGYVADKTYSWKALNGTTVYGVETANAYGADVVNVMVNGKLVKVAVTTVVKVGHEFAVDTKDDAGKALTAKCGKCGVVGKVFATKANITTGYTYAGDLNGAVVAIAGSAAGTTTVESAKTFDAGIALYAGMALASVAGSAVVIGKKKEF